MQDVDKSIKEISEAFKKESKKIKGIKQGWSQQEIESAIELLKGGD